MHIKSIKAGSRQEANAHTLVSYFVLMITTGHAWRTKSRVIAERLYAVLSGLRLHEVHTSSECVLFNFHWPRNSITMIFMPCSWAYRLVPSLLLILFNLSHVLTLSLRLRDDIRVGSKPVSLREETPGVESYSGSIRLQSGGLKECGIDSTQDYLANIFFWYFQNRKKRTDSPLTVYCECIEEDILTVCWLPVVMGGPAASSCKTRDVSVALDLNSSPS